MPIQRQHIFLIAGVILAIVAALMVNTYIEQQKQAAQKQAKISLANMQANQTAVLVAKQDIPKGSAIEAAMLETSIIPNKFMQPNAATSLDRVAGMVTVANISKGEQITLSKLANLQQKAGGGNLAGVTPVGKRAITVSVDTISSVAGMIKPGDYVDVFAMVPVPVQNAEGKQENQVAVLPLFQNVLVLAVGQDTGDTTQTSRYSKKEEGPSGSGLITLALGPQESSLMAFVQEQGKIRLVLRSPADAQVDSVQPASWETLFRYVMPQPTPQQIEEQKRASLETSETASVEIYRGLNKEKIPLSK